MGSADTKLEQLHICTAEIPGDVPSTNLQPDASGMDRLAMPIETFWPNGKKLRVKLLPGSSQKVRNKVKYYAQLWEQFANIDFRFVESGDAEIRVAFDQGKGSWSYIGSTNLKIPANQPTMNFGWFDDNTREEEFSRVTVHEFGHALGCIHEHQNPNVTLKWNKEAVYARFMAPPNNWTKEMIDHNILDHYAKATTKASAFDDRSIMLYFFPPELFLDGVGTPNNVVLSPRDKQFIGMMYPFQTHSSGAWSTKEERQWYPAVSLNVKQVDFSSPYMSEPQIAVGLNELDVAENTNVQVKAFAERISTNNFVLHVDAWGDTALYSGGASWVEFDGSDSDFQTGIFEVTNGRKTQKHKKHIVFKNAYDEQPKIVVWLSGVNMSKDRNVRITAFADNVTKDGCDVHLETWGDSAIDSASATWIAYPSSKEGVTSGSDDTNHHRKWFPAQLDNSGKASFDASYDKPPKVYLAVNRLDFDASRNVRFEAKATDVTEKGFTWNVKSWADSLCYGAGVSWIAFG